MSSGRVGQAFVLTCFFTAGYGRHRKLGVGFRTAGYGRHRSQWVKKNPDQEFDVDLNPPFDIICFTLSKDVSCHADHNSIIKKWVIQHIF